MLQFVKLFSLSYSLIHSSIKEHGEPFVYLSQPLTLSLSLPLPLSLSLSSSPYPPSLSSLGSFSTLSPPLFISPHFPLIPSALRWIRFSIPSIHPVLSFSSSLQFIYCFNTSSTTPSSSTALCTTQRTGAAAAVVPPTPPPPAALVS